MARECFTSNGFWIEIWLVCSLVLSGCSSQLAAACKERIPLGMAFGRIPSASLSASTTYRWPGSYDYGPSQARPRTASCWCGTENGTWSTDWVQVAFGSVTYVTGIAVEGGSGRPADILTEFYLQYSEDGIVFANHTSVSGKVNVLQMALIDRNSQYFWFDAFQAKYLRIRAAKLLLPLRSSRFCLRFELFGCNSTLADQNIFSAGLENQVASDSQFFASSSAAGTPAAHAKLNFPSSWCPVGQANEWLQVDLRLRLLIMGIATQGAYGRAATDMVSSYYVSHGNSTDSLVFLELNGMNATFPGNNKTSEDPVFNEIETGLVARYLRIHPLLGHNGGRIGKLCMRVEVFVSHPECSTYLTSEMTTKVTMIQNEAYKLSPFEFGIYSGSPWCPAYEAKGERLRIDFADLHLVTGIAIVERWDYNGWAAKFNVKYGLVVNKTRDLGVAFQASRGRGRIAVKWLASPVAAKYLEIVPSEFFGGRCFGVLILGCKDVPTFSYKPTIDSVDASSYNALINITPGNVSFVTGVSVKYVCENSSRSLSCRTETTRIFPFEQMINNAVNLTNLQPWTKYRLTLRLVFNASISSQSNTTSFQTTEAEPKQAPSSCNITMVTTSSISFSWKSLAVEAINGVLVGYRVTVKSLKDAAVFANISTSGQVALHTFNNLNSNAGYSLAVYGVNNAGFGPSCVAHAYTLPKAPGAPMNFTLVKLTTTLVRLDWNAPEFVDGDLQLYILSHKELSSIEKRKNLLPNLTYYYFNTDNQTGVYEFKVRGYSTIPGHWSYSIRYFTTGASSKPQNKGTSFDSFSRNSMIALVTCAGGVMFFVLSCILGKAAYEKYRESIRRKTCFRQWSNLQQITIKDFLETKEETVDKALMQDRERLRRLIADSKSRKMKAANNNRAAIGPAKYFEAVSASAQSSGKRSKKKRGRQNNHRKDELKPSKQLSQSPGPNESPQLRKIGIDNSAFEGSFRGQKVNKEPRITSEAAQCN